MNTFIVHPKTQAQEKAIKAVLEAMKIDFEADQHGKDDAVCILPAHVLDAVKKSEEQFKNGQYYTNEEIKKEFQQYL